MKLDDWNGILKLLLVTHCLTAMAAGQDVSQSEQEKARRYLVGKPPWRGRRRLANGQDNASMS